MEGVRAEMVKAILAGQDNDEENMDEDDNEEMHSGQDHVNGATDDTDEQSRPAKDEEDPTEAEATVPASTADDNKAFLKSRLRYETDANGQERCIDAEGNGVMMGWELPIMEETARLLAQHRATDAIATTEHDDAEFAVLNVGFGLGLIDSELQKYMPTRHVIIEPHPDVLAYARQKGWYDKPGVHFFEGTWREYIAAFEAGEELAEFDAVYVSMTLPCRIFTKKGIILILRSSSSSLYPCSTSVSSIKFDTFSEHYADLHAFFSELPNLLRDETSLFSFFHGLGATSMTFYEVYTHVSEMHLNEIGLKTAWSEVDMNATEKGENTWEGITRRVSLF